MIHTETDAHPGQLVRSVVLEANSVSITEAAQALGVTRPALSALINGRADLSAAMALRMERVFGVPIETSMGVQNSYAIAKARRQGTDAQLLPFRRKGLDL
ncbi:MULTISPECIES: HigA family addiction module antitoxin [unclassified Sphingomonas]|uniref:HigA family addiction module antitoxin n=1 Tax=unclassified Sphingomonas TaxID=196159 RepID=UPI0009E8D548|nr:MULTISPECIES: HigA family addiction module antitoxin [unclassified Sphingomonas]